MRRFPLTAIGAAVVAVMLSGCGSNSAQSDDNDVTFTSCSTADCTGTLPSGAEFDIILPEDWNGTLAIYSHGLDGPGSASASEQSAVTDSSASPSVPAAPAASPSAPARPPEGLGGAKKGRKQSEKPSAVEPAPASPPVEPRAGGPELAPRWGEGDRSIADIMLQAGYAIAGATPTEEGWVVADQVRAAEELHQYFRDNIGAPNRVYAWGESTGGLASARLAQLHPDWVSGALAMCAPLSGPVDSYNLALDIGYAVRQLLAPDLKLFGYTSADEARQERDRAVAAVERAATGPLAAQAKVAFIAAIGLLPTASRTDPGLTWEGQVAANRDGVINLLEQTTMQRQVLEQRFGGNFSGNAGTDYQLRVTDVQRQQLDEIQSGLTDRLLSVVASGTRVTPEPAAVDRATEQGTLDGSLEVPTLTLHNALDPVYIAQNVSWYRDRLAATGGENVAELVEVYALPPQSVSPTSPAAEGIGNCTFETRTILGSMIQLNQWVRNEQYPGRDTARQAFKNQRVSLDYNPGPWPQMSATAPPAASPTSAAAGAALPREDRAPRSAGAFE